MGIGHSHHHHGHEHNNASMDAAHPHAKLMRRATYASIVVATMLIAAKMAAWWSTESLSMLSSLTDSLFDLVSSVINMFAVRYALKPADEDHRFGHTSIEDLAGLAQFVFITASMLLIILQSVERLYNPHPLSHEMLGIAASLFAIFCTTFLVMFQTYVSRKTNSLVIATDRLHYIGDLLFNFGVLSAIALTSVAGLEWADPAIAILIAAIVLWSSFPLGLRAFNNLMDREMSVADKAKVRAIINGMPDVWGVHWFKTRYSGTKAFIQMHVDVDASLPFKDAHDITDRLEKALLAAFPHADIIIHPDPVTERREVNI